MRPKQGSKVINFTHLKSLLLSTDFGKKQEYRDLLKDGPVFLDRSEEFPKVAFASWARTGNSFLRKLLEQVTGVFTGSDMQLEKTLPLQQSGLLGEQIQDNSVWITKTHYPQTQEPNSKFAASKIIYITRHPVDVFPSMCGLFFTNSHVLEPKRPWNEYRFWPVYLQIMIPLFRQFHERILEQAARTPTFFLTYE